jgi:hypothetical protein
VDLVLVSHLHNDHLHLPSLRLLGRGTHVVVPRGGGAWLRGKGFTAVTELSPGEQLADGDLTVTGVQAVHSGHRWGPRSTRGPDAVAMGHLLTGDGTTVYAAGDTDVFPGMAELGPVDVPVHWGTLALPGLAGTRRMRSLLVDPPRTFAADVAAAGLDTQVLVTEPGARVAWR